MDKIKTDKKLSKLLIMENKDTIYKEDKESNDFIEFLFNNTPHAFLVGDLFRRCNLRSKTESRLA